jgi:hypothetical protein
MRRATLLFALFSLLASGSAFADGEVQKLMTSSDKARLDNYGETRRKALDEARSGDASAADLKTLDAVLARPIVAFSDRDLTGNWQCRSIKVGGHFGVLVVYDWFRCKVSDDGAGWVLEKLSGSQRTRGRFYDDNAKRAIYLGSYFVEGDPIKPYGSGPKTDQVGYAFRTGARAWRIEFPAPYYESTLDILEFRR